MDSLTLRFGSTEQLQLVAGFVESIFIIHRVTSLDTIKSLNNKLASMDSEAQLSVDLSKNEATCLKDICDILGCIGTDSVIAGLNVASKIARLDKEEING